MDNIGNVKMLEPIDMLRILIIKLKGLTDEWKERGREKKIQPDIVPNILQSLEKEER